MKKNILSVCILVFSLFTAQSQIAAGVGKIEFKKGDKAAAVIELPYPPEIVEDAIKDYLSQRGMKQDRSRGFQVFRGTRLQEFDQESNDLYFKVERKSRQAKNISIVYLITGRAGEDIALRSVDDHYKIDEAMRFLNNMAPSVESHNLNVDITNQDENVKKAEKKLKSLEEDQQDLEKRIKNLQEKLEENKKDQRTQAEEVTKQKIEYEALKSRKRG